MTPASWDEPTASVPKRDTKRSKPVKPLKSGWLLKAWQDAQTKLGKVDANYPKDAIDAVGDRTGPVDRARGLAELSAPGDMILLTSMTHGLSPEQVEAYAKPLRLLSDLAQRRLSMVGLKSGEAVEHDMSDRLRSFLELWHSDRPARVDVTPASLPEPREPGESPDP